MRDYQKAVEPEEWVQRMVEESLKNLKRQGASEAEMEAPRKKLQAIFRLVAEKRKVQDVL